MKSTFLVIFSLLFVTLAHAEDTSDDALMKAVATDKSQISASEKKLFRQSIKSTKESVARETLDVFYKDALEAYRRAHYDEALDLLDNIYSVDPYYEDVTALRETIRRLKNSQDIQSKRGILEDYMRKGNEAYQAGQNVAALGFWKQALVVNASYAPAKRKIKEVNHKLAQKQYEAGYLYYHHGDLEEALDSWSNSIALDPSFKQRGLLQLMSKVQLSLRKDKVSKLSAEANRQYSQKNLTEALETYNQILEMDSRNDDARRMASKIKFQLGAAAFKSARDAMSQQLYGQAIQRWQEAIKHGYEVQRSQKGISDAERLVRSAREEKPTLQAAKTATDRPSADGEDGPATLPTPRPPEPPPIVANPEEANQHYRQGLAAIREKDYHRAVQELEIAAKLNPADEHIYVAKERAKQEWAAINAGKSMP